MSELDYGTVMCWANNLAGRQQEPCIFHIIAAGKPDPPYNCTIVNMTNDSLEVECNEGFDGKSQHYLKDKGEDSIHFTAILLEGFNFAVYQND